MSACPTCGITPTCTCNVFTPTPGPCRVHGGLLKPFKEPVYFGGPETTVPTPQGAPAIGLQTTIPQHSHSIDRALFDHFLSQPDSRSGELH